MDAFESRLLDLPDFYFRGDDYRYRFEPEAKQRFLELLRERFNSAVRYRGHALKWDTVIEEKMVGFGRSMVGRASRLDFSEPSPNLRGMDDQELRARILSLTQQKARRLGIGGSTLHYLRNHAMASKPWKIYMPVMEKIIS